MHIPTKSAYLPRRTFLRGLGACVALPVFESSLSPILRAATEVHLEILDHYKRPVSATADSSEVRDVVEVTIRESRDKTVTLLYDPEHNLEERILNEQFAY